MTSTLQGFKRKFTDIAFMVIQKYVVAWYLDKCFWYLNVSYVPHVERAFVCEDASRKLFISATQRG
jgi:hypothetical protein